MSKQNNVQVTDHGVTHLGIIMDGNRRWARSQGLQAFKGHEQGAEALKQIAKACQARGIKVLTVYALSTENLTGREAGELAFLFKLIKRAFIKEINEFVEAGIRIKVLGRRKGLPDDLIQAIDQAQTQTADCDRGLMQFCINYGGRAEITDALMRIAQRVKDGSVLPDAIDETVIASHLYNPDTPNPDLIIRTSGEQRLSNFLTWQSAYSELYFTDVHWPAFSQADLDKALQSYASRSRRFGGS